jgi:drug/metabolite transporter (DMT)-like permease
MIPQNNNELKGIVAGVATGVFWGFPFWVPQMLPQYASIEIAAGRFFFFGVVSLIYFKKVWTIWKGLSVRHCWALLGLSALGFWAYSTLLFLGIQLTDGIIASLILGLLPVTIPLFTPQKKIGGKKFYAGLASILVGLLILFLFPVLSQSVQLKPISIMGIGVLLVCLVFWTAYAILNSRFLQQNPQIDRRDFASVMGVISFVCLMPLFLVQVDLTEWMHRDHFQQYLIYSAVLGLGSSWIANWLWNICSFYCRTEVSGPLIVFETVFGLLYTFAFQARLPVEYEAISIIFCMVGVWVAVRSAYSQN